VGFQSKLVLAGLLALPVGAFAGVSVDTGQTHNSPGLLKISDVALVKDAFGWDKSFGLVSLTSDVYIVKVDLDDGATVTGLIAALDKDKGYMEDSRETLSESGDRIRRNFSQTTDFMLMPERAILVSAAYDDRKEDKRNFFNPTSRSFHTANGYKLFNKKKTLKKLAAGLNLDAAVHLNIRYGFTTEGWGVKGAFSKGACHGTVTVEVLAVDREGTIVWKDSAYSVAQTPVSPATEWSGTADFTKLTPTLHGLADEAIANLLADLATQLQEKSATAANQ
jgi:hypothetical protein